MHSVVETIQWYLMQQQPEQTNTWQKWWAMDAPKMPATSPTAEGVTARSLLSSSVPTTELWEASFPQTGGRLWLEGSLSAWVKVHCSVLLALPKLHSTQCQACRVVCLLTPSLLWFASHFISSKCFP